MSPSALALLVAGLVLLVGGAEFFVRGASRLAAAFGISPLVIGLTVVAFGTSSPEIAVSVQSAFAGAADLALGNVIGSNICNVLLILGLSASIAPLVVSQQLVKLDVPVMVAVSFAIAILGFDRGISRGDGALLLVAAVAYTTFLILQSRRQVAPARPGEEPVAEAQESQGSGSLPTNVLLVIGGLALLILGSRWLVTAAVDIARLLGVGELVIGLTIVAVGTSLPEVATSIIATVRGERDIAVGNVVGSNIFNILLVLGTAAVVAPGGIPVAGAVLRFDLPVMIAVAAACLPIFFTGNRIDRWEGILFLGYYVAYTAYLVLASAEHDALPVFSSVMAIFVIPLTVITLLTISYRAWRVGRKR